MSLFYIGLNPRWQMYRFLPDGLNMMFSAAGFWDEAERTWRRKRFPRKAGLKFLDSGGFTALNKWGDYPFTPLEMSVLAARLQPEYYASMDYPCEPEISRESELDTNRARIEATVANAATMMGIEPMVRGLFGEGPQLVPVIQGYSLDEYRYCIDRHHRAGTIRPYMAVGSMCRRISSPEPHRLVPGIYEYARAAGVERLHFFGLKLSPDLADLEGYIYSRDSAVALDSYNAELRAKRGGRRWPRGQAEKQEAFEAFLTRIGEFLGDYPILAGNLPEAILDMLGGDEDCINDFGHIDRGLLLHLEELCAYGGVMDDDDGDGDLNPELMACLPELGDLLRRVPYLR